MEEVLNGMMILSTATSVDGFSIAMRQGNVSVFVSFSVEGSLDGLRWEPIGSSSVRRAAEGPRFLAGYIRLNDGDQDLIDLRPPWPLIAETIVESALLSIACFASASLARSSKIAIARKLLMRLGIYAALAAAAVAAGYVALGQSRSAALPLSRSAAYALAARAVTASELWLVDRLGLLGLWSLLARALDDCLLSADCANLSASPPVLPALLSLCGAVFVCQRRRYIRHSLSAIAPDRAALAAAWERALASDPDGAGRLCKLDRLVDDIRAAAPRSSRPFQRPTGGSAPSEAAPLNPKAVVTVVGLHPTAVGPFRCPACPGEARRGLGARAVADGTPVCAARFYFNNFYYWKAEAARPNNLESRSPHPPL